MGLINAVSIILLLGVLDALVMAASARFSNKKVYNSSFKANSL